MEQHLIWVTFEVEDSTGQPVFQATRVPYPTHDQAAVRYAWMANNLHDWLLEHGHPEALNARVEMPYTRGCETCDKHREEEERAVTLQQAKANRGAA